MSQYRDLGVVGTDINDVAVHQSSDGGAEEVKELARFRHDDTFSRKERQASFSKEYVIDRVSDKCWKWIALFVAYFTIRPGYSVPAERIRSLVGKLVRHSSSVEIDVDPRFYRFSPNRDRVVFELDPVVSEA